MQFEVSDLSLLDIRLLQGQAELLHDGGLVMVVASVQDPGPRYEGYRVNMEGADGDLLMHPAVLDLDAMVDEYGELVSESLEGQHGIDLLRFPTLQGVSWGSYESCGCQGHAEAVRVWDALPISVPDAADLQDSVDKYYRQIGLEVIETYSAYMQGAWEPYWEPTREQAMTCTREELIELEDAGMAEIAEQLEQDFDKVRDLWQRGLPGITFETPPALRFSWDLLRAHSGRCWKQVRKHYPIISRNPFDYDERPFCPWL